MLTNFKKARAKFSDAGIQDISTSISIMVKFEEMSNEDDDDDESDKHLEARDRRYSCLIRSSMEAITDLDLTNFYHFMGKNE